MRQRVHEKEQIFNFDAKYETKLISTIINVDGSVGFGFDFVLTPLIRIQAATAMICEVFFTQHLYQTSAFEEQGHHVEDLELSLHLESPKLGFWLKFFYI